VATSPARLGRRLAIALGVRIEGVRASVAAATLPRFATPARGLVFELPRQIRHPERIWLGDDVKLGPNSVLKLTTSYPGGWLRHPEGQHVTQEFDPALTIGHRVTATSGLQVIVYDRVTIEDDVLFAGNVFVADGTHGRARGDLPYKYQGIERVAPVHIGRGAWIGQNVMIMPGVTIGALAIIGANSVVSRDVPDGCIAVGAPARVVRRWDAASERWLAASEVGAEGAAP
jgi:acetyltransferase-like isoleucine patch superfamily enzyme